MTETRVFQVGAADAARLQRELQDNLPADADWRRVDHARFSVKALGVVLTCYRSGKLVAQGKGLPSFAERFLTGLATSRPKERSEVEIPFDRPTIASDEAGKGDYFGPLVVAAVFASPDDAAELRAMGVADSKTLSDRRMMAQAQLVEERFPCAVCSLPPAEYNERYRKIGNLNDLLADMHVEVLGELADGRKGAMFLVDRFAREELLRRRLQERLDDPPHLVQVPRAEAHAVVAAASIVARVHFLEGLRLCEEASGTDLHKGAGSPVDVAARRVHEIGGMELLAKVAKLHFKNTGRIPGAKP